MTRSWSSNVSAPSVSETKSISFVQIAHSYLGIDAETDDLDMRNDFMFTGMAVKA